MFGYKNHAGIDREHGFIRGWTVTSASGHGGARFRNVVAKDNTASTVWADSAYRSKTNEEWLTGQQEQTATPSQPAAPFFKARILLADTRLNASEVPVRLLPGMTVSTEIKVGKRTVISYFLYPLLRGLDNAIREP